MFDDVLVAVDGSEPANRAAALGFDVADRYDARVDLVHVVEGAGVPDADARERGREVLDAAGKLAAGPDLDVETHLLEGRPHEAITAHARERGADLVVVGRHGRTGIEERLLGTVTHRVLRRTDVPVLTVPAAGGDLDCRNVLVTTDGSENAEFAAPYATDVARRYGATLHVLDAVDVAGEAGVFDAGGVSDEFVERLETRGWEATDRVERYAEGTDVDVRSSVVRGVPHEAIREYVHGNDVDLVVMASEGESNLAGQYLGSVTDRVLRTVAVPVLVVTP